MRHFLRKLKSTITILACLFMARMFGQYLHSGRDGTIHYARYSWRGYHWIFPTGSVSPSPQETAADIADEMAAARRRITVLEMVIRQDLHPLDCSDDLNKMIVQDIYDRFSVDVGRGQEP